MEIRGPIMNIRPIHNRKDHEQALARLTTLLESDPVPESDDGAELQVLSALIEKYEAENFPVEPPTPTEAIRFRMDQLGLRNKDLVPYIGSASKVSEVLNGKRPLSLTMIRNLHRHLGIPAEVLIQDPASADNVSMNLDSGDFPAKDMYERGYFSTAPASWAAARKRVATLLPKFFRDAGVREASPAYCRSTAHYRQGKTLNVAALLAWQARVLIRSRQRGTSRYRHGSVDKSFLEKVADLSVLEDGPRLAPEFLEKHGVTVVIEPHLQKTYLDGAAFLRDDGKPVIGLTLRYDKLDNFWFTLLHELVHVGWHLSKERNAIFDDINETATDDIEREADAYAAEALIPEKEWRKAKLSEDATPEAAELLAQELNRHPAIIVGRLQHELDNYKLLARSPGVGRRQVRKQFEEFSP
jgi:HTH-type transcriptional regulator/antitoxin HigA